MDAKVIGERVEGLTPALVEFLQRMVQTPSLPNEEGAVQDLVAAKLRALGLAVDVVPTCFAELAGHPAFNDDGFSPDQRVNVIGRWGATETTPANPGHGSLLLNGHVDVVSPGDERLWSVSPWSGLIQDGKLYGRGSCDMKAGITAALFAVTALKELGYQPAHDILVQSVIGEESGGVGALTTIVKGYQADAAIILEPTRMELCPVQAGALTFRLTVAGKATHAAMKNEGISAIDKFMLLNGAINALNAQRHARYHTRFMMTRPTLRRSALVRSGAVCGIPPCRKRWWPRGAVASFPVSRWRRCVLCWRKQFTWPRNLTRGWPTTRPAWNGSRDNLKRQRPMSTTPCCNSCWPITPKYMACRRLSKVFPMAPICGSIPTMPTFRLPFMALVMCGWLMRLMNMCRLLK